MTDTSAMTPDQIADAVLRSVRRGRTAEARLAEVEAVVARVEALCAWGNGRETGGVDRLVPASEIRAALDGGGQP